MPNSAYMWNFPVLANGLRYVCNCIFSVIYKQPFGVNKNIASFLRSAKERNDIQITGQLEKSISDSSFVPSVTKQNKS